MIKKIVLENFKSYKQEEIVFRNNFSAVIGPNGSGKSNIMDAICFVLNVENAAMRTSELAEFIYRDEAEKAGGKSCSVSLVLGSDSAEFEFKRSIIRKGKAFQSEFRVDSKKMSQEEYEAQLNTLNVFTRAKNFLVFQGDVASIGGSSNSMVLTKLFEQVSGSGALEEKYLQLKAAKEKADESAVMNFQKKRGMDAEKRQFKDQESEAQRYRELLAKQAALKQEQMLFEVAFVNNQLSGLRGRMDEAADKVTKAEDLVKTAEGEFAETQKELGKAKRLRLQGDTAYAAKLKEHMKINPSVIDLRKEAEHLSKKIQHTKDQERALEQEHEAQKAELTLLEHQLHEIQRTRKDWEAEVKRQSLSDRVALDERQLEQYNTLKEEANRASIADRNRAVELRTRLLMKEEELASVVSKEEDMARRQADLVQDAKALEARIAQQKGAASEISAKIADLRRAAVEDEKRVADLTRERDQLTEALVGMQEQLRQEKIERKQSEKEKRFAEALESMKRLYPGVRGRLGDLTEPRQKKYQLAAAVAMGRHMDAIVVDDRQTAIECVQYMRSQRVGVATFLPLDSLNAKSVPERLRSLQGSAKLVLDVLVFDKALEKAVLYAVGTTMVCDTEKEAKELAFGKERQKSVTLAGTVIHKSGVMSGGGASAAAAKKWSSQKLEGLKKTRNEHLERLEKLAVEVRARTNRDEQNAALATLQARLTATEVDVAQMEGKMANLTKDLSVIERELKSVQPVVTSLRKALEALKAEVKQAEALVNSAEDRIFKGFCQEVGVASIRQYEREAVTVARERNEHRNQLSAQEARLASAISYGRSRDLDTTRSRLQEQLKSETKQLSAVQKKLAGLNKEEQALMKELESLKAQGADAKKAETEGTLAVKASRKRVSDCAAALVGAQKEKEEMEARLRALQSRRHAVLRRAAVEEVELPVEGGVFKEAEGTQSQQEVFEAEDELEFDVSSLREELAACANDGEFDALFGNIQAELQAVALDLGRMNPNLKALEKLKEVQGKVKEMEGEIREARKEGQTAAQRFQDVRDERLRLFMSCFKHVQDKIEEVYDALTRSERKSVAGVPLPGGKAFLSLQDPQEPWSGGVTYQTIPPTKRLWNFDQLSGGEKSLASLALIFAIQSFRPSPFFVLDEIDAALDGQNVEKVTRFVQECAKDCQFIVISLKDAFFSQAEALIGVYKDNLGECSKTLSIDLASRLLG